MTTVLNQQTETHCVLELEVNNHAGVMAHIAGLFSRRTFNLEAILVLPTQDKKTSRVWLMVDADARLNQMVAQIEKLEDVLTVRFSSKDKNIFSMLELAIVAP